MTAAHLTQLTNLGDSNYQRECRCGWQGRPWNRREAPGIRMVAGICPEDRTVTALVTLQFANGGLLNATPTDYLIHLVRSVARGGTPGPTLCGVDRFADDAPGWSVGGGVTGPTVVMRPCADCAQVARTEFAGVPVCGSVGGREMAAAVAA